MSFVMDASITASWCLPDESDSAAERAMDRIARDTAVVPSHWWFELRNVLLVAERRGRIRVRETRRFLRLLGELPIETDRAPDETAIFELARRHGLTFYDAAYLELALRHDGLASLDAALVKAAKADRVKII